jgi:hypothetical protein
MDCGNEFKGDTVYDAHEKALGWSKFISIFERSVKLFCFSQVVSWERFVTLQSPLLLHVPFIHSVQLALQHTTSPHID